MPPRTSARAARRSRSRGWPSTCARRAARSICTRRSSAGRTSTTSSRPRRPRSRSTCRSARSKQASPTLASVPGRFQLVSDPADDVRVVVDYAHTDDALKNLLETARPLAVRTSHHGLRLRRRSGPHEASADGSRRRALERPRDRHLRQPALGGSGANHRGDQARHRRCRPTARQEAAAAASTPCLADRRSQGGHREGDRTTRGPGIWCSSRARATRRRRRSATRCCRSMTWTWPGTR